MVLWLSILVQQISRIYKFPHLVIVVFCTGKAAAKGKEIGFEAGGCDMPKVLEDPHDIDGPVIVKYAGAKGGRGYFIARDYRDFRRNVDIEEEFTIQEYVLGCRYYLHFFFDPIAEDGYQVQGKGKYAGRNLGRLELLSMDRRDESNVDEFYKLGSLRDLREMSSNHRLLSLVINRL